MLEIGPGHKYYNIGVQPEEPKVYALYCYTAEKILLLVKNKEDAIKLCILISSKIHLVPIRIDEATNYRIGLLDNSCCMNYSLSNLELVDLWKDSVTSMLLNPLHKIREYDIKSYEGNLIPSTKGIDDLIITIRNFLYLSLWTLEQIDRTSSLYAKYSYGLISALPDGIFDNFYKMRLKCTDTIYLGTDFEQTCSTVEEILDTIIKY